MEINDKPVRIVNKRALKLVKERANREGRSASNAAAWTIIEALAGHAQEQRQDTGGRGTGQVSFPENIVERGPGNG